MKKFEFIVEDGWEYVSEMPFKKVDSYRACEYPFGGYDVLQVEAEKASDIHIQDRQGNEYCGYRTMKCFSRYCAGVIYAIGTWDPIAE